MLPIMILIHYDINSLMMIFLLYDDDINSLDSLDVQNVQFPDNAIAEKIFSRYTLIVIITLIEEKIKSRRQEPE